MAEDIAVVYLAAGMSARFGGTVKQLASVGCRNETLIEISVHQAIAGGAEKIIFVVGDKSEGPFREKFGNNYNGKSVFYARQQFDSVVRDGPWGTADSLCAARYLIDWPFIVCNGDDLYGQESFALLKEHLDEDEDEATLGYRLANVLPDLGSANRAIFEMQNNYVQGLKETFHIEKDRLEEQGLNPDVLCSMNIFALHQKTLEYLEEEVTRLKVLAIADRQEELLLPDEIAKLIKKRKIRMKLYPVNSECIGITHRNDEEIVRQKIEQDKETADAICHACS